MQRGKAIIRLIRPIVLMAAALFLIVYGATLTGILAMLAALAVFALRAPARRFESAGLAVFALAALTGLPAALYNFSTESCVGAALDLSAGDVRSLSDPRLSAADRAWAARTYQTLSDSRPQGASLSVTPEAIANLLVRAPAYVRHVLRPAESPLTPAAAARAGEALVAKLFDRRAVCHAFGAGPAFAFLDGKARTEETILTTAKAALSQVAPALRANFEPAVRLAAAPSPASASAAN